jgi:drug/metabolite transporter (DMT)-like permease
VQSRISRIPALLLFCAVLFWSGHNVVAKAIIADVPPFSFTFLRWLIATLLLLPFAWPHLRRDWRDARKSWQRLLLIAVLGISAFNTMLYVALQTTSAVNVGLISAAFPAAIALLSLLILKISLNRIQLIGMLISFLGVMTVVLRGEVMAVNDLVFVEGDLWMLAGILCGAMYPVLLHDKPAMHPLSLLTITIALGTAVSLPLYLFDVLQGKYVHMDAETIIGLAYVGLFPSVVAYLFWNRGIELVGANHAGLYLNLVPVLTAVMASAFLQEALQWFHFAGLVLVVGGMLLFNLEYLAGRRAAGRTPGSGANTS